MENVFLNLLNISITAGWVVIAVVILRFILKKAPKWISCALWAIVGLRLILPFSLESVLSLIPSTDTVSVIADTNLPNIQTGVPIVDAPINQYIDSQFAPSPVAPESHSFLDVVAVMSIIWMIGMVVMAIYSIVTYLNLRRKVSASVVYRDNIYFCDNINSPFILGILKPRIYLPSGISCEQINYVVCHENAHLKRKDHWFKPLGFALLTVYWFNPILWLAYVLLCRDIEMACDQKAVKAMDNEDKKGYSQALVDCSVQRRMIMACPLAFGEVGVKNRVKSVLNYKKPAFWIIIVAVITCIAVAVGFLTDPLSNKKPDGDQPENTQSQGDFNNDPISPSDNKKMIYNKYIKPFSSSGVFNVNFSESNYSEIDMYYFFLACIGDKLGNEIGKHFTDNTYPTNEMLDCYTVTFDEIKNTVTKYYNISDDALKNNIAIKEQYHEELKSYLFLGGLDRANPIIEVENFKTVDNMLTVQLNYYNTNTDGLRKIHLDSRITATIKLEENGFKFISNQVHPVGPDVTYEMLPTIENAVYEKGSRKILYPQLKLKNNPHLDKINLLIKDSAISVDPDQNPDELEQNLSYNITYYDNEKISIVFSGLTGKIHRPDYYMRPGYHISCININLKTGELIALSDLVNVNKRFADKVKTEGQKQFDVYMENVYNRLQLLEREQKDLFAADDNLTFSRNDDLLTFLQSDSMKKSPRQNFYFTKNSIVIPFRTINVSNANDRCFHISINK